MYDKRRKKNAPNTCIPLLSGLKSHAGSLTIKKICIVSFRFARFLTNTHRYRRTYTFVLLKWEALWNDLFLSFIFMLALWEIFCCGCLWISCCECKALLLFDKCVSAPSNDALWLVHDNVWRQIKYPPQWWEMTPEGQSRDGFEQHPKPENYNLLLRTQI